MMAKNRSLCKENASLKDRVSRIETSQIRNNIIISSVPESKWEPYDTMVSRVHDTIAAAISTGDIDLALEDEKKMEVVCCSRIG